MFNEQFDRERVPHNSGSFSNYPKSKWFWRNFVCSCWIGGNGFTIEKTILCLHAWYVHVHLVWTKKELSKFRKYKIYKYNISKCPDLVTTMVSIRQFLNTTECPNSSSCKVNVKFAQIRHQVSYQDPVPYQRSKWKKFGRNLLPERLCQRNKHLPSFEWFWFGMTLHDVSGHTCRVVPCRAVPCRAMSCHVMSCHVT